MAKTKKPKKPLLTEDEKLRRRSARKAEAVNAKIKADAGPLYVEQIPPEELLTAEQQYWKYRHNPALGSGGHEGAYLAGVDWKVDVYLIRRLAQRFMSEKDYQIAVKASKNHGDEKFFWRNILLGRQRIVLSYWRHVYGVKEVRPQKFPGLSWTQYMSDEPFQVEKHVEVGEALVWPPEGYIAPLTKEQLEAYLALPVPIDFAGAVDPLNLANQ